MYSYIKIQTDGSKHWHDIMSIDFKFIFKDYVSFLYGRKKMQG